MKRETPVLTQGLSSTRRLPVEQTPRPAAPPRCLRRLTLGGALCGGFAGSFVGALLGAAIGAVCSDLSLGLDGALAGGLGASAAGAVYGLFLALRERKRAAGVEETLG